MARKVLVLDGHPSETSFSSALAEQYSAAATAHGADLRLQKLSGMHFNPDLTDGRHGAQAWEADLETFWANLTWAEHFVLVHPLWWGGAPAKLKGLFDRALLPGLAFAFKKGMPFPKKLLKGRTGRVILTSDTPDWYFRLGYHSAYRKQITGQILALCGIAPVRFTHVGPVRSMKADRAERFLAGMGSIAARDAA